MQRITTLQTTTLKTLTLATAYILAIGCGVDKASAEDSPNQDKSNNGMVESKATADNLQSENSQDVYYMSMSLQEFYELFQTTIKNKDTKEFAKLTDIGTKSSYTLMGLTNNFDAIFHADLVKQILMTDYRELKERTLPNGEVGKVFAYDFEDIEDKTIELATFLYFQKTSNGWKLVNVDEQNKELCVDKNTVFSCKTKSNKIIKICESNDSLTYSYGKKDKPEIMLTQLLKETNIYPVDGGAYNYNYDIEFKNGSTIYSVYSSKERGANGESSGGVSVINGKKKTNVSCSRGVYDNAMSFFKVTK